MFENVQVLRNTMNNSSTRSDKNSKQVAVASLKLAAICNNIRTLTGTVASIRMRVVDFVVEVKVAELFQRSAHNDFKDFYDMGNELNDNYISAQDKIYFFFLQRVPATMQNFADVYDGFCSASVHAGVMPMCLETS